MIETVGDHFKLIIIIVKKDLSRKIIKTCVDAGSEGGTVFHGKGTGKHETGSILGVKIEPHKDIILTLVEDKIVDEVLKNITNVAELDKPGTGIAIVLNSKNITGIAHLLEKDF
jgi:nitrogen regulatory protein PII